MAPCQNSSAPASSIQLNQYTNPMSLYSVVAFGLCVRVYIVGMITVRLSRQRISVTGMPASTKRTPVPSPPAASHHLPILQFTLSNTTHTQSILTSTCTRSRTQPHTSTLTQSHNTSPTQTPTLTSLPRQHTPTPSTHSTHPHCNTHTIVQSIASTRLVTHQSWSAPPSQHLQ
mgnify:CR=1 FL=1